jgi:hypothetical protein
MIVICLGGLMCGVNYLVKFFEKDVNSVNFEKTLNNRKDAKAPSAQSFS